MTLLMEDSDWKRSVERERGGGLDSLVLRREVERRKSNDIPSTIPHDKHENDDGDMKRARRRRLVRVCVQVRHSFRPRRLRKIY